MCRTHPFSTKQARLRAGIHRAAFVLLGILVSAPLPAQPPQGFTQTLPLPPNGVFELHNINGSVRIDAWDRDEVLIQANKIAHSEFSAFEQVHIRAEAQPGRVRVLTRYPENERSDVQVDFRIRVPARVRLERVETINGHITVRGVEGEGELRTVNGDITLLAASGRFSARSTNGNVHLEFRQLARAGAMVAETVNGTLTLVLPSHAGLELQVSSHNGDFISELPILVRASSDTGEFHGVLGTPGPKIHLRTVNGGIRVATLRPVI
ncbi:MAG: DUF4097 family beta strand repeat-containing protein [Firmicutes bacterium]|nr:DUF4097 family beta strand repeat-containing protein [Bacillota bacterium]